MEKLREEIEVALNRVRRAQGNVIKGEPVITVREELSLELTVEVLKEVSDIYYNWVVMICIEGVSFAESKKFQERAYEEIVVPAATFLANTAILIEGGNEIRDQALTEFNEVV